MTVETKRGLIFDIKRDCSEDGPGIRTTVFFKGCPLSCVWCQNPEGKSHQPQISYLAKRCNPDVCDSACVKICPENCLQLSSDNKLIIDHERCSSCNKCIEVCPGQALEPVGYWIDLDELLYRVCIDKPFFDSTGGGVTLSGGEVTQQMNFAGEFLKELKARNINTAIETSGFFNYRKFSDKMLPFLDLIYFDFKLIDPEQSRKYTGQTNSIIIDNFKKLINEPDISVIPRIPLIPEITTNPENLQGIASLLRELSVENAILIPYNPLWHDKLEKLGKKSRYDRNAFMSEQEKNECVINFFEKH
ncbi:MAG: glycyl-radical enzyme activating protein [Gammaproteobacteria bacterium]|nr:glycyl-radical enzyme activating protein [Gammaproteobacteria bacterium]